MSDDSRNDAKVGDTGPDKAALDRRVAMQRLALHAGVTAPMMMAILTSEKAVAASITGGGGGGGGGGCVPECVPEV